MKFDRADWGDSWESRFGYVSGWLLWVTGMPRPVFALLKWPLFMIGLLVRYFVLEPIGLLKRLATRPSEAWGGVDLATRGIWRCASLIAAFVSAVFLLGFGWVGRVIALFALLAFWWALEVILILRARRRA